MNPGNIVAGVVGVIGATWLFWAGLAVEWQYEHAFVGWRWHAHLAVGPLTLYDRTFVIAPGLAMADAARLEAAAAGRDQAVRNEALLTASLSHQTAQVRALAVLGAEASSQAESAVSSQRTAAARAAAAQASIGHALDAAAPGQTECQRAVLVDQTFLRTLP